MVVSDCVFKSLGKTPLLCKKPPNMTVIESEQLLFGSRHRDSFAVGDSDCLIQLARIEPVEDKKADVVHHARQIKLLGLFRLQHFPKDL